MPNYDTDLTRGSNLIIRAIRAARDGDWQPSGTQFALLYFLALEMQNFHPDEVPTSLFDEIRIHLREASGRP
jgi:hypothetical protein